MYVRLMPQVVKSTGRPHRKLATENPAEKNAGISTAGRNLLSSMPGDFSLQWTKGARNNYNL